MKCDLSDVWKRTLEHKRWEEKMIAERKAREEAHIRQTAEIKELQKQGWEFTSEECYHPHNSDTWLEASFKSPRMQYCRRYHINTDLKREEASSLADSYTKQFLAEADKLIDKVLRDYFYENQEATTPPPLTIQVINALPSRQQ